MSEPESGLPARGLQEFMVTKYKDPYADRAAPFTYDSATLSHYLRMRAGLQRDMHAYTFLVDGEGEEEVLTYGELDLKARAIAAALQDRHRKGERALLLYPPGLEFTAAFFGCLYAGIIAVPAYPPRSNRNSLRLQSIIKDAQATVALSTRQIVLRAERLLAEDLPQWIATDDLPGGLESGWREVPISGDTIAFLQYTSGSTGEPKGVVLSHDNLLFNAAVISQVVEHVASDKYVSWLPTFHDMGFMAGVLEPLYAGLPVVLMPAAAFLQKPFRWLDAISRYKATTSGGPNFAYDLCVRKTTAEQRATLDLSSWSVAFNGAEPIRAETLDRFADAFADCGFRREAFYPCYGLAEATLMVTGGVKAAPPVTACVSARGLEKNEVRAGAADQNVRRLVGCGGTMPGQKVVIANPQTLASCESDQVGEIWSSGASIARGYWNNETETEQIFNAHLVDTGEGPFLRTGDLGFVTGGELFVTGRLKDILVIRGKNHYPQDIELTAERSHPALRPGCGAAFAVEHQDEERLALVQEIDIRRAIDLDDVIERIRRAISEEHELQVYAIALVKPGAVPKTSSGKTQRRACREAYFAGGLDPVKEWRATTSLEPETPDSDRLASVQTQETEYSAESTKSIESRIRYEVAKALAIAPAQIDVDKPVTQYGLDSLAAIELAHSIETAFDVRMPMFVFLEGISISQIAAQLCLLKEARPESNKAATPTTNGLEYRLSFGQKALWFLYRLAPDSSAYNLAAAIRIRGSLNTAALRRAFQILVDRHALLRATFLEIEGEPFQRIHTRPEPCFYHRDVSDWDDASLQARLVEEAHTPFNLESGPPLRVCLFTRSQQEHVLSLTVHHMVADFWSLDVLMHELAVLYEGERDGKPGTLPPLACQYSDYVRWQEEMLAGAEGQRLWEYWRAQLSGAPPLLSLPTDRPHPLVQSYRGDAEPFELSPELARGLRRLSLAHGVTLYTVLLTAFQVLLSRYTGQEDISIGSPSSAGRARADMSALIGYLVNTLVLRGDLSGSPSFVELLARNKRRVLAAFEHQEYPFSLLVERLQPARDPSHSPLFQVMFVLQKSHLFDDEGIASFALGTGNATMKFSDLILESLPLKQRAAQVSLTLMMSDTGGPIAGCLQYNTDLFDRSTITRLCGHLQTLLEAIVADPDRSILSYPLLTENERTQLLVEWNSTGAAYPRGDCIHSLFEAQVEQRPHADAIVFGQQRLTYAELNKRANRLAHYLRSIGVGPEVRVGICMRRSLEMVVAMLGVLKAGGAYVPLDPAYPEQRVAFMLEDAEVPVLLTQQSLLDGLPAHSARVIAVDALREDTSSEAATTPHSGVAPGNLAYVIYTSGSTGNPKGVAIEHRSAIALLYWAREIYPAEDLSGVLATTSICFDLAIFELFAPLSWGGKVILAESILDLSSLPSSGEVRLINTVPSAMSELLRAGLVPRRARTINLAGEPLQRKLVEQAYQLPDIQRVYNLYGPSEDTTYSTYGLMRAGEQPTIGRPIANTQVYLLDTALGPVPVGIPGELYIAGEGLARCYLDRPELTAERFLPNPFSGEGGGRIYKTGDLARYQPGGEIEFLGRVDQQVKVRGFRIEPGEIEANLSLHPQIKESLVLLKEDAAGNKNLLAYVVPERKDRLSISDVQRFIRQKLPDYMMPSAIIPLDALPLTPNGKVDRMALPEPDAYSSLSKASYKPPRNEVERIIASAWAEALLVERVGIDDNVFDLGGHSLLLLRVHSQIQTQLDRELSVVDLLKFPTVKSLAKYLIDRENPDLPSNSDAGFAEKMKEGKARQKKQRDRRQKSAHTI